MKKTILASIVIIAMSLQIKAQPKPIDVPYKTAIGIRYAPFGFSLKVNNSYKPTSIEVIANFQGGFIGSFYYYYNLTLDKNRTMRLYLGGGGQAGFKNQEHGGNAVFGVAGIVGFDYKFKKLPIDLSLDWQPGYQVGETDGWQTSWGGIAVRFAF